jgi:hypothetical protein
LYIRSRLRALLINLRKPPRVRVPSCRRLKTIIAGELDGM